jgi:hypothetical protein
LNTNPDKGEEDGEGEGEGEERTAAEVFDLDSAAAVATATAAAAAAASDSASFAAASFRSSWIRAECTIKSKASAPVVVAISVVDAMYCACSFWFSGELLGSSGWALNTASSSNAWKRSRYGPQHCLCAHHQ